jgi:phosphoribosylformimino-5-aminoimidazole carboxamide ribonucleotide (ProFAR) isomerase
MSDFLVIPAIELRGGMALRYESTGMGTRANRVEPVGFAKRFAQSGARMVHLYNLDGPFIVSGIEHSGSVLAGAERNLTVMGEIAKSLKIAVQVSGGVRDLESFKQVIKLGVHRAAIGSSAMQDPSLVAAAVKVNADGLVVFLDTKGGKLVSQEWIPGGKATTAQVAQKIAQAGVKRFIYQDIGADAAGTGPRLADAAAVGALGVEVIVTGGVNTLDHIKAAAATDGIAGVIVGKPLMMGEFTFEEALEYAKAGLAAR